MRYLPAFFLVLALSMAASTSRADDSDGTKVYKKVIPSVVWIHSTHNRGTATGSGTLIDKEKRIVLTNYHVVEDNPKARVFFPYLRDGKPVAEKKYYQDRANDLAISGRVLALDKQHDLALIQLDRLPKDVPGVALSASVAEPGQSVHSLGNTGKSDALWGYVPGKVRQVYSHEWKVSLGDKILRCKGEVVETDSATNPGDSGGPLLNDKGELVGVTHGGATNAQLLSTFISVTEVKKLLKAEGVRAGKSESPSVTATPKSETHATKREKATTVSDAGKFFTEETAKSLQEAIRELHEKQKLDLLVETFATVPKDDLEKVKGMKPGERTAYMREWATKRGKAETITGVVVIISNEPKSLYVAISPDSQSRFPADFNSKLVNRLTDGLKNSKANEAILDIAKLMKESAK